MLKRELNKQERASDAGMKSAAMGIIPFALTDDLRAQLQAFALGEEVNWIEMVGYGVDTLDVDSDSALRLALERLPSRAGDELAEEVETAHQATGGCGPENRDG